jgi:hypothetical protein
MTANLTLISTCIFAATVVFSFCAGQESSVTLSPESVEYIRRTGPILTNRLEALARVVSDYGKQRDYDGLKITVRAMEQEWRSDNWQEYQNTVLRGSLALRNSPLPNDLHLALANEFEAIVRSRYSELPANEEAFMMERYAWNPTETRKLMTESKWVEARSEETERILKSWQRAEEEFARAKDAVSQMKDGPTMNVMPPDGAYAMGANGKGIAFAGMPPDAISDPVKREEYRAMLAENTRKIETGNLYHSLKLNGPRFKKKAEQVLAVAYSTPPFYLDELKELMGKYLPKAEDRERILTMAKSGLPPGAVLEKRPPHSAAAIATGEKSGNKFFSKPAAGSAKSAASASSGAGLQPGAPTPIQATASTPSQFQPLNWFFGLATLALFGGLGFLLYRAKSRSRRSGGK